MRPGPAMAAAALLAAMAPERAAAETPDRSHAEPGVAPQAVVHRGRLAGELRIAGRVVPRRVELLEAPALPDLPRLVVEELAAAGAAVERGQVVVRLRPVGWSRRLERADERVLLARAGAARRRAELDAEAVEREVAVSRAELALERAELLTVEGVGLTPRLQAERQRLDRQAAALRLEQARRTAADFERRRAVELERARAAVTEAEQGRERLRALAERMLLRAPLAGRFEWASGMGVGVPVRCDDRLAAVHTGAAPVIRARLQPDPATAFAPAPDGLARLPALGADWIPVRLEAIEPRCAAGPGPECRLRLTAVARPDAAGRLRAGMAAELRLRSERAEPALVLDRRAVVQRAGQAVVWCLEAPVGWRAISIGRTSPELVEVAAGLQEGWRVSLEPQQAAAAAERDDAREMDDRVEPGTGGTGAAQRSGGESGAAGRDGSPGPR